jgi:hypothetical protein
MLNLLYVKILWLVKELRQGIINKVDGPSTEEEPLFLPDDPEDEAGQNNKEKIPSNDALQKFEDYGKSFNLLFNFWSHWTIP